MTEIDSTTRNIILVAVGLITAWTLFVLFVMAPAQQHMIPLREVTVCSHINTTATQCYKYWAHIGPIGGA